MRKTLINSKRIVIKVGTSSITHNTGKINLIKIEKIARILSDIVNRGTEVILVTSGAIGVGIGKLNLKRRPVSMGEKQAVAAVGQCELMHIYSKFFSEYGHTVAQLLLTKDVVDDTDRRKHVQNTFLNLFKRSIIPIVNENDTISVEEIENIVNFGDNDTLSATVSDIISADLLIILSDIDGLYNKNPKEFSNPSLVSEIIEITSDVEKYAGKSGSDLGTGGMFTKINAAKIATSAGVNVVIANGEDPYVINDILNGINVGTLFIAKRRDIIT